MISCEHYDYIEIACLYRFPVRVTMRDGAEIEGVASDTKRNTAKQECLELMVDQQSTLIVLEQVSVLDVLIDNPHFKRVTF